MKTTGQPQRVLITGGAGFLGSHLADRLLQAGYQVRLLDSLDPQVHPNGVPEYLPPEAELQIGSVLDSAAVERALAGVAMVVHFAAVVGVGQSLYQIRRYHEVNIQGTATLLEALLAQQRRPGSGLQRLLVASSMSLYGEGRYTCVRCGTTESNATRELARLRQQQWEPLCRGCGGRLQPLPTDEAKPAQYGSYYALTKAMQEEMFLLFGRTYQVPAVALRFINSYGPRQALSNPYTGVAAVFAAALLRGEPPQVFEDGAQLRDLVSVHDVTLACQLVLQAEAVREGVFNIARGVSLTVAELARQIAHALGKQIEPMITGRFRCGDARHCIADISAARRVLGFTPKVNLADGMGELAEWLQQHTCVRSPARRAGTQAVAIRELQAFGLTG